MGNIKDTFFFPHDFGARNDPKLLSLMESHGVTGIGLFWCIIEQIYEQGGTLPLSSCKSIAFALHVECKVVEDVVMNHGLFKNDGEVFWSESVNNRLDRRKDIADKRKAAAEKRWQTAPRKDSESKSNAKAQGKDANAMLCNAIKEKERKGKENKDNDTNKKDENAKRFTPPLLDEVRNYISEKGYSVDAESFIAFYQSKNWFIGKNKMKDWRAAVVTWEKRSNENKQSSGRVGQSLPPVSEDERNKLLAKIGG